MKNSPAIREERFSGGIRLLWPVESPRLESDELVRPDWSLARTALDHFGRLVRLIDLPPWLQVDASSAVEMALAETPPMVTCDAVAAGESDFEKLGIEVEGGNYRPANRGWATRWEFSPGLSRLRGSVLLAAGCEAGPPAFTEYLLRLNRDLRFARVGYLDRGIALQVVLAAGDRRWLNLAEDALRTIRELLRPQVGWWNQLRELVADLLREAGR
jgi:hypothetical protein